MHRVREMNRRLRKTDYGKRRARSWCEKYALFKEILATYPDAPVGFLLRNFTRPTQINTVFVEVKGLGDQNQVYYHCVNCADLFPQLANWVTEHDGGDYLRVSAFVKQGREIATLIGRPFKIVHQFGSGIPDQADYKNHGPFLPWR